MREFLPFLTAAGLPLAGGLAGASLADLFSSSQVAGAAIGGICGLLSVVARGVFELLKLRMQHRQIERQLARYRRKLLAAGIPPDTED
jgi:hypothetical protein